MKKLVSLLALVLLTITFVSAQGNGCGNGNSGHTMQQSQNGVVWQTARKALKEAAPFFHQQMNLNFGQLVIRYMRSECTVSLVSTNPPTTNTYFVAVGGIGISVIIDNF